MAIQSHHASHVLHFKRNEKEVNLTGFGVVDESPIMLPNVGGHGNPKKRTREELAMNNNGGSQFLIQSQPLKIMRFNQYLQQSHDPNSLVSNGLQLQFGEQNICQDNNVNQINFLLPSSSNSCIFEDVAGVMHNYKREVQQILHAKGEELRLAFAKTHQNRDKQLLLTAEKALNQKINQTELNRLVQLNTKLENQLMELQAQAQAWQAKAITYQATAASLQEQIDRATAAADDAESGCEGRWVRSKTVCRVCLNRAVSVVVLPCRHLCMCEECGDGGGERECPVCFCVGSRIVKVSLC